MDNRRPRRHGLDRRLPGGVAHLAVQLRSKTAPSQQRVIASGLETLGTKLKGLWAEAFGRSGCGFSGKNASKGLDTSAPLACRDCAWAVPAGDDDPNDCSVARDDALLHWGSWLWTWVSRRFSDLDT